AVAVALGLVWLQRSDWPARWLQQAWMLRLGQISYSVFLIHFPVCLLVNAVVNHFWPAHLLANALGLLTAFGLSLLAGEAMYRAVESPGARWRSWFRPALAAR
ncbi:MAG: acyltransferase family protein, partial [Polaromonas sp.]